MFLVLEKLGSHVHLPHHAPLLEPPFLQALFFVHLLNVLLDLREEAVLVHPLVLFDTKLTFQESFRRLIKLLAVLVLYC
jgi:hypothetical protein